MKILVMGVGVIGVTTEFAGYDMVPKVLGNDPWYQAGAPKYLRRRLQSPWKPLALNQSTPASFPPPSRRTRSAHHCSRAATVRR